MGGVMGGIGAMGAMGVGGLGFTAARFRAGALRATRFRAGARRVTFFRVVLGFARRTVRFFAAGRRRVVFLVRPFLRPLAARVPRLFVAFAFLRFRATFVPPQSVSSALATLSVLRAGASSSQYLN